MEANPNCNGKYDKDKDDNDKKDKDDKGVGWMPVQTVMENMIRIETMMMKKIKIKMSDVQTMMIQDEVCDDKDYKNY